MSSVAIVILNWNGAQMMRRFLPSVVAACDADAAVVVADNGSTDDSLELLRHNFPQVRVIPFDRNYGFAEGYNMALRQVEADYYVLLNSDVEVPQGWLAPLREYLDTHPDVAACQPKIRAEYAREWFEYAGAAGGFIDRDGYPYCRGRVFGTVEKDCGQYDTAIPVFWATGAALMIRSSDWHAAGGLDGRFFAHNEEIDLCWRLRARGRGVACVPAGVVYHVGGGTLPQDNPRKTFLNFRNNLLMLYKNLPEGELRAVMRRRTVLDWVAALKFALTFDFQNARAVLRARREFRRLMPSFKADRERNLSLTVLNPIPERSSKSILYEYYIKRKKLWQPSI